jgi:molybdenum cofactor cytidylyltransferase
MTTIAAILLAAGQSRRMGAFKPLLPFGDRTVIESCLDYLQKGGAQTIVVVLGHHAEDIREKLHGSTIKFALNPDPESEMGASIACGVRELPIDCHATLIALTDQPAIPVAVVADLITQWRVGPAKLLIPEYEGRGGHPVLVDWSFRESLLHLDSQRGLRSLFENNRDMVARVPVNSPFIARDIDTWDDYRALHRQVFGAEPPELKKG